MQTLEQRDLSLIYVNRARTLLLVTHEENGSVGSSALAIYTRRAATIDTEKLLALLRAEPSYAGQITHIRHEAKAAPSFARCTQPLSEAVGRVLSNNGINQLYSHQARALDAYARGRNVVVATSTASGKSLCYWLPIVELMTASTDSTALLLFPTKALCQDQYRACKEMFAAIGYINESYIGIIDGDTPSGERRRLLEQSRILFTNPDMLHASLLPNHARWGSFLSRLRLLVLDELHTYNGMFGSNSAHLFSRLRRVCQNYGSHPQIVACSATVANPGELAERLTGSPFELIDNDGSPHGDRTYVLWNPPATNPSPWRTRRSANVEAHELMTFLLRQGVRTITFSKAKMTAEMICRYVRQSLQDTSPQLANRVMAYRGGYVPSERRAIERRLFTGELMGISSTRALELGIDVGGLDACLIVGYPGNTAAFWQQAGRAGRREAPSLVVMIALDTPINQYIVEHPEYLFERSVESAIIEPHNPYIGIGQMRCAAYELPLEPTELEELYPDHDVVLRVLQEKNKLFAQNGRYYHIAREVPHHEVSLRGCSDATVVIQDIHTGKALGHLEKYDAGLLVHPGAVYMHQGDTYLGIQLDLEKGLALVEKKEVDYYTQPCGGTGLDHIDRCVVEKPLGQGMAYWGEVTTSFNMMGYERIPFYEMDAVSVQRQQFNGDYIQTTAVWMAPSDAVMKEAQSAGHSAVSGLKAIVYATHMVMPLFITCDTYDFWHAVGCANAPWNTMFIYEHHPFGLGFTRKAFDVLPDIMTTVHQLIDKCPCTNGCPCCVGSPLRRDTVRNVERGEGSIPSKQAALFILDRWLDGMVEIKDQDIQPCFHPNPAVNLEGELRRFLERRSEVGVSHPVRPWQEVGHAQPGKPSKTNAFAAGRRGSNLDALHKELHRRMLQGIDSPDNRRERN